jgi:hypothetical protein
MILTAAERQLLRMIRATGGHDLTLIVRVRDHRYTVRITTYDDGGPGAGLGYGSVGSGGPRDGDPRPGRV